MRRKEKREKKRMELSKNVGNNAWKSDQVCTRHRAIQYLIFEEVRARVTKWESVLAKVSRDIFRGFIFLPILLCLDCQTAIFKCYNN